MVSVIYQIERSKEREAKQPSHTEANPWSQTREQNCLVRGRKGEERGPNGQRLFVQPLGEIKTTHHASRISTAEEDGRLCQELWHSECLRGGHVRESPHSCQGA